MPKSLIVVDQIAADWKTGLGSYETGRAVRDAGDLLTLAKTMTNDERSGTADARRDNPPKARAKRR